MFKRVFAGFSCQCQLALARQPYKLTRDASTTWPSDRLRFCSPVHALDKLFVLVYDSRMLVTRVVPTSDVPRLLSGRPVLPPLSEKQQEVLAWLIGYSETKGYFPVVREIAAHLGVAVSRAQAIMAQLEKRGYVAKTAERSRNIQLTELTKSWYERQEQAREGQ